MTTTRSDLPQATIRSRPGVWLFFVGLGALIVSLAQTVLIPVLATLPKTLHTSAASVEWLLTSTLLVGAVAVPLLGRLGDMFGKRLILLVGLGALIVGSIVTALTDSVPLLIAGRAIQGLSAAVVPLGISLLASLLPRERAAAGIGIVSAMLGVGGALGLPLAAFIAQNFDYHALFWVTGIGGAVSFVGVLLLVPESAARNPGRVDYLGTALLAAALVCLLLPLAQASAWGWGSIRVIGLLVASLVLFGVFGVSQLRSSSPLVDLAALRRRPIVLTNIASVFFGFALFASLIGTASYVQAPTATGYGFGTSILVAGLTMLPSGLFMLLLSPSAARIADRVGGQKVLAFAAGVVAVGWILRIVLHGNLLEVIIGSAVVGIGSGVGYTAMPTLINSHTPRAEIGSANGLNTLLRTVGSSLASAIGGSVLAAFTVSVSGVPFASLGAYQLLFAICAGAALSALVIALFIPARSQNHA